MEELEKGKSHKVTSELYFSNMGSRSRWSDLTKIDDVCRGPWRNHSFQFWFRYFIGFGYTGVKKIRFPLTLLVIVTTVLNLSSDATAQPVILLVEIVVRRTLWNVCQSFYSVRWNRLHIAPIVFFIETNLRETHNKSKIYLKLWSAFRVKFINTWNI